MQKRKAFTLIELLIVIAIIAILAVIVVMNLISARDKADYAKAQSELKGISDAAIADEVSGKLAVPATANSQATAVAVTSAIIPSMTTTPTLPNSFSAITNNNYKIYYVTTAGATKGVHVFILTPKTAAGSLCEYFNGNVTAATSANCQY